MLKLPVRKSAYIILSLGGGSTLQCAKGIAGGLGVKGDLKDLWNGKKKLKKAAVIGAVLTDPASGSELGQKCTLVRGGKAAYDGFSIFQEYFCDSGSL